MATNQGIESNKIRLDSILNHSIIKLKSPIVMPKFKKSMNHNIIQSYLGLSINQALHSIKCKQCIVESTGSAVGVNSKTENRFSSRAREDTVGAGAGVGGDELEER
nr:hypothetical protein Itr_chr03CG23450 [Ipomoea trifida]